METCDLPALLQAAELLGLELEPAPGTYQSLPDYSLGPSGSGYLITIGQWQIPVPEPGRLLHFLASTLPKAFHKLSPDPVLHASACVADGEAVLFCGRSESGKSSLAAEAWAQGLPLLNDDSTAIDPATGLARPYPHNISLRLTEPVLPEPFASRLGPDSHYMIGRGWKSDYWALLDRSLPRIVPYGTGLPVRALHLVSRGEDTRLCPADRQSALRGVLSQTYPGRAGKLAILPWVEALAARNAIFELTVGDHDIANALSLAIAPIP
ncbi:MAG: hypothetical protein KQH53_15110 [Desulfarculaceae bacterium]|nr:hypothetical protein [Desulfarculaceae bacterium]